MTAIKDIHCGIKSVSTLSFEDHIEVNLAVDENDSPTSQDENQTLQI